ncbi:hypothetical protein RclHR1_05110003 [Rhizophagus clarus]|nr:hypothetical protein RclHR1_05110003 [Rhizophagus clarus]
MTKETEDIDDDDYTEDVDDEDYTEDVDDDDDDTDDNDDDDIEEVDNDDNDTDDDDEMDTKDNEKDNDKLCLALQVKITNKPNIINKTSFNKEYNTVNNITSSIGYKFALFNYLLIDLLHKVTDAMESVPADEWVHLFLTNAKVKNKKNSALVTEKEF